MNKEEALRIYNSGQQKVVETLQLADFIDVKGWKAIGNKLVDKKLNAPAVINKR